MSIRVTRFGAAALLVTGLWGAAQPIQAQPYVPPKLPWPGANNLPQYNPYGMTGGTGANPYTPVTTDPYGAGSNPYSPAGSGSPYNSGYNPYYNYIDPFGGVLRGQADVMRAYGTVITSQEYARIMRESAKQAYLETRKKQFDLEMYIRANTPTYQEEQAKIARSTLKRIQGNSTESEIVNGKALNYLLDDLRKYPGKKAAMEPIHLSEDVLLHLNLTKNYNGLGILRNEGKFEWPIGLPEMLTPEAVKAIEAQAENLVKGAAQGKVNANVLRDLGRELDGIRDVLSKKVNDMPTSQYLQAKRFLNDFEAARTAVERGEAATQFKFQKWAAGGKTLQQLVDYMVAGGLRFATATPGDEFAYRAVHSGMAAFDVAINAQLAAGAEQNNPDQ
jgi:hypothetical protein